MSKTTQAAAEAASPQNKLLADFREWRLRNPLRIHRHTIEASMSEIASLIGCSIGTIQQWEDGTRKVTAARMPALCRLLDRENPGQAAERWQKWYATKPTV